MDVHAAEHVTEAHHLHVFQDFAVAVFARRFLLTPHCKRMRSSSDNSEPMPCCLLCEHPSRAPQLLAPLSHGAGGGGEDLDLRLQQLVRHAARHARTDRAIVDLHDRNELARRARQKRLVCAEQIVVVQHGVRDANAVFVRFNRPLVTLPEDKGLKVREKGYDFLKLEHTGPLQPLLNWLGQQAVAELRVEPLGLSAIYHRYHGVEA